MKRTKEQGITLIALIVTIIVLLILAGITISLVLGQDGIFRKAETAKGEYIVAQEKELIGLAYSEYKMNKMDNESYTMQNALDAEKAGATAEGDETYGWDITFTDTGHQYTLNGNGSVEEGIADDRWDGVSKEEPQIDESKNWHIYNCAQMKFFADFVNGKLTEEEKEGLEITEDTVVYLEADLDLGARANSDGEKTAGTDWEPVGVSTDSSFIGTFEGNNHYIKGIYVNLANNFGGIFGNSNSIQNLTVKDSYIKATNCAGGITAVVRDGNLDNCYNVNTTVIAEEQSAGGIVGQFSTPTDGVITNCSNTGSVSGKQAIGGIAGYVATAVTISDCRNSGKITGEAYTGGIVGYTTSTSIATISHCDNSGMIIGGEGSCTGGIVGYGSMISDCSNNGSITSKGNFVGGIVGCAYNSSNISNCKNTGNITVEGTEEDLENEEEAYTGGVVGSATLSCSVTNCYNTGNIVVTNLHIVGGVAGQISKEATMSNSYNTGDIEGLANVGGCVGIMFGTVENCYNTGNISATASGEAGAGGIAGQIGIGAPGETITVTIRNSYNTGNIIADAMTGGIVGYISETRVNGVVEYVYNSGRVEGKTGSVGGLVGRHGPTINIRNGYNKGEVVHAEGALAGGVIGQKSNGSLVDHLYYLNTINLPAVGSNVTVPDSVTSVEDDISSYEEFLTWIETKQ